MLTKSVKILFILIIGICSAFSGNPVKAQLIVNITRTDSTEAELQNQVATILKASCSVGECHRGERPKKKLNLEPDKFWEFVVDVLSQEVKSLKRVDTKNPEKSYLLMKIKGEKGIKGERMPDEASPLKKEEIKTIEDWIFSLKRIEVKEEASPADSVKKRLQSNR